MFAILALLKVNEYHVRSYTVNHDHLHYQMGGDSFYELSTMLNMFGTLGVFTHFRGSKTPIPHLHNRSSAGSMPAP
jgi:hypothetical protein